MFFFFKNKVRNPTPIRCIAERISVIPFIISHIKKQVHESIKKAIQTTVYPSGQKTRRQRRLHALRPFTSTIDDYNSKLSDISTHTITSLKEVSDFLEFTSTHDMQSLVGEWIFHSNYFLCKTFKFK